MYRNTKVVLASALTLFSLCSAADQQVLDDLIVVGSQCVGDACTDTEDFGFDTLRLKADDPRISFVDTSNTAAFPTNDWLMGITSESLLDAPYFYLIDQTSQQSVLKISAGDNSSVALGSGSELVDGAISVGAEGAERRITHVAEGTADSDAVTKEQMDAAVNAINARIDTILTRLNEL